MLCYVTTVRMLSTAVYSTNSYYYYNKYLPYIIIITNTNRNVTKIKKIKLTNKWKEAKTSIFVLDEC